MALSLIKRATNYRSRTAIVDHGGTYTYDDLLNSSAAVASGLLGVADDLTESRVAFLVPPSFQYVVTQWAIWRVGGIAVPLGLSHPPGELAHVLDDSEPTVVVAHPEYAARAAEVAEPRKIPVALISSLLDAESRSLPEIDERRRAMMLYTSGTTGKPKGVVTTHGQIQAQVTSLVEAWEWSADDKVLLVLPLHHVHGIVNVVTCALWSGACCEMLLRFDAIETWSRLVERPLTLFMAVPTIYRRLIAAWEDAPSAQREKMSAACAKLRLMVSGSAALPVSVLEKWRELSGHVLCERYGMTEIGMGLSNPLHGERVPGSVGMPLPRVEVSLVDEETSEVPSGAPGEIAVIENGRYRIMGRRSVDIIKTGGYKVSALEIEEELRAHETIRECAVVGAPDAEWGERVCVAVELAEQATLTLKELRHWARDRLAPYKIPMELKVVSALPRNAMGKVTKPDVVALFSRS
jgi:malonyl-CoA/methylmalonyl-CoA synthetase